MSALLSTLALVIAGPPAALEEPQAPPARVSSSAIDRRRAIVRPYRAKLHRMARCESGGRWHINTGNGYYGGLQFDLPTWWSVGGRSYPHLNSKLEQMYRAVLLIRRRGYQPWPVCGSA